MKPKYLNRAAKELLQHEELFKQKQAFLDQVNLDQLDVELDMNNDFVNG